MRVACFTTRLGDRIEADEAGEKDRGGGEESLETKWKLAAFRNGAVVSRLQGNGELLMICLLYTSPSPRDS